MTSPDRLIPPGVSAAATRERRWASAFQSRFFLALLLGLVWTAPAWWNHRAIYLLPVWDVLALLAWAADLRRLPEPAEITVERRWKEPVSLDIDSQVELHVTNHGKRTIAVTVEDDVPTSLSQSLPQFSLTVAPGATAEASYSIRPSARGNLQMGRIFIRYHGAVKFAERWAVADTRQTIRVYPNLLEPKRYTLYLLRSRQMEQEKRLKRLIGRGREFESLREYRESDELRDICWSATARRGKLISKTYRVERSQSVFLVVDAGRLMLARTRARNSPATPGSAGLAHTEGGDAVVTPPGGELPAVPPLMKLDYAVNAALSLAHVALQSGDTTGLLAYGRKLQTFLPAARGADHLRQFLERLALVNGEPLEADHALAADSLMARHRRRSLVVWLTDLAETAATPDVIEAASRLLPRHLLLFAVVGQPELRALAAQRPETPSQMYQYVAAQQVIQRRELLMRRMREQGALAMEFLPGELSSEIVNHYLQVKWKGLI